LLELEPATRTKARSRTLQHRVGGPQLPILEQEPRVLSVRTCIARHVARPALERLVHAVGEAQRAQRPNLRRAQRRLSRCGGDRALEHRYQRVGPPELRIYALEPEQRHHRAGRRRERLSIGGGGLAELLVLLEQQPALLRSGDLLRARAREGDEQKREREPEPTGAPTPH
jgi:hypothetical protein